jgi:hypothetical protein
MLFGEEAHLEGVMRLNGNSLDHFRNLAFFPCHEIGSQTLMLSPNPPDSCHPTCASPLKKLKLT